ncbi:H(+)/Cl(-) exchange transporter 5 [Globomyces sp. JEL0801]|nr:H(+)/Cl(-) exchange transporter 5 [Globomyces sp. JEL0801]
MEPEHEPLLPISQKPQFPKPRPLRVSLSRNDDQFSRHSWSPASFNQLSPITTPDIDHSPFTRIKRWLNGPDDELGIADEERIRLRGIKNLPGFKGKLIKYYDASQAWIVLALVGLICGLLASLMDISIPLLDSFRYGFCREQILLPEDSCGSSWISWSALFNADTNTVSMLFYVLFGGLFAFTSTILVTICPDRKMNGENGVNDLKAFHCSGSGIPEVKTILGGFVIRGCLGLQTLVYKVVALIFAMSAGLVVGVQGPLVHVACAVGNVTSRLFQKYSKNDAKRREIMSAACAAGVSVAFGAPIGGVLFSLEEASYYFPQKTMWRAFFCALIAAVTLKLINPLGSGKLVLFQVSYDTDWHIPELIPFLILGIFGGLFGALFIKLTSILDRLKSKLADYGILQVLIVSLLTSLLSFPNDFTRRPNTRFLTDLFSECDPHDPNPTILCRPNDTGILWALGYALCTKAFLMIITFGIRIPGGIFIPSMVVGACMGRMMGISMQLLLSHVTVFGLDKSMIIPGVYALVGAAATLSGVTRMTVSLTVIMFELTGALTYVLPLMVAIMSAKWVADAFGRLSIYDLVIQHKGYPFLNHKRSLIRQPAMAQDIMEAGGDMLDSEAIYRLSDIEIKCAKLERSHPSIDGGFPIVKSGCVLVGYISQTDITHALDSIRNEAERNPLSHSIVFHNLAFPQPPLTCSPAISSPFLQTSHIPGSICDLSQWVDKAPLSVSATTSCEMVVELFMKLGIRTLLVVKEGVFVGVIHKKRILSFINTSGRTD